MVQTTRANFDRHRFIRTSCMNSKENQKHNMKKISGGLFPGETNGGM
jgi:hypothetical protein